MPIRLFLFFLAFIGLCHGELNEIIHLSEQQKKQLLDMEQELDRQNDPKARILSPMEKKMRTIRTVNSFLHMGTEFLQENENNLKKASTEEERDAIREIGKQTREKIAELRKKMVETASGITEEEYLNSGKADESSLSRELRTVLAPLLGEFHNMTAWPRELSTLQSEAAIYANRLRLSRQALGNVRELKAAVEKEMANLKDPQQLKLTQDGMQGLFNLESIWSTRATDSINQMEIIKLKIKEGEANAPTFGQIITIVFHKLWEKLGVNLLLSVLVFGGTAFTLRFLYYLLRKFSPLHKAKENNSRNHALAHLADLSAFYISLIFATAAVLSVLYIRGDGLLITILILILIWMGWSLRNEIPAYIARSRLMLNLGSLRVGERVTYQGLPWRVESINLFCEFRNPALEGGRLRVPLQAALTLISRPVIPGEFWFPTQKGDYYALPNGERAVVLRQTVEQVQVDLSTGGMRTYSTQEFIKLSPEVLTQGFDLVTYLEVDYKLQPIVTTTVPRILHERILAAVEKIITRENIVRSFVDFNQPLASSLQLICYIKVKGHQHKHYSVIRRLVNKVFIETCTEQKWNIPYPHLTVTCKTDSEQIHKEESSPSEKTEEHNREN